MKYVGNIEPHYGLRKLSIGVASVLLGISFSGMAAHADTEVLANSGESVNVNQSMSNVSDNANNQVQSKQAGGDNPSTQNIEGTTENQGVDSSQGILNTSSELTMKKTSQSNNDENPFNISGTAVNRMTLQSSIVDDKAVSVSQQPISNLKIGLTDGTGSDRFDWYVGTNDYYTYNINISFDIDAQNIVAGKSYSLGYIDAPYSNNDRALTLWTSNGDTIPFTINGNQYGTIRLYYGYPHGKDNSRLNFMLSVNKSAGSSLSGMQSFKAILPWGLQFGYAASPKLFNSGQTEIDDPLVSYDASGHELSRINLVIHAPKSTYSSDTSWSFDYNTFGGTSSDWANSVHRLLLPFNNDTDLTKAYLGQPVIKRTNLPDFIEEGGRLIPSGSDLFLVNANPVINLNVPVFHSDGKVSNETFDFDVLRDKFTNVNLGDNLSIQQMSAKSYVGFGYSRQTDGSYYYLLKIPSSVFTISDDNLKNEIIDRSWQVVADSDPAKAIQVTIDRFHAGVQLWNVQVGYGFTDGSIANHLNMTRLWNNFMDNQNTNQTVYVNLTPAKTQANGQSTVKLHLINSINGADLSQVQSFTDWPDQGKKANLAISVPTGYQLVTSNTSDILKRLSLTGTAITGNTQVDYPKENTISDYYVLLAPKMENATINIVDENENNKVLYSGQVSGAFNSVIAGSDDINSQLKKLLNSGLYDLDHNGLSDGGLYKDGTNTVTISLKHHIDSTERHYRVIEDLPDGTEKVIVDLQATLYKDADSKFWYQDGAYLDGILQGTLLKHNHYVLTAGTRNQGDPTWLTTPVDRISGYSASMAGNMHGVYTDEVLVSFNDQKYLLYFDLISGGDAAEKVLQSGEYHIIYTKNSYPVTISYYDTTGKQIATSTTTHTYQDVITSNDSLPAGYVLLAGQTNQLTVGVDHNELDLLMAPIIQRSQETKRVTRTIVYDDPNIKPVVQVVTLHHDKFTNIVNNSVSYGQWMADGAGEFAAYVPVLKSGYVADSISAEQVNGDSRNETVSVHYQAINGRKDYKYIDVNGVGYDSLPVGFEIVNGQDTNKNGILIVKKPAPVVTSKIEYVTRTITIIMPNGKHRTIIQKTRKGGKFLKPHLPKLRGYNVDANSDVNVMIKFVKM